MLPLIISKDLISKPCTQKAHEREASIFQVHLWTSPGTVKNTFLLNNYSFRISILSRTHFSQSCLARLALCRLFLDAILPISATGVQSLLPMNLIMFVSLQIYVTFGEKTRLRDHPAILLNFNNTCFTPNVFGIQ